MGCLGAAPCWAMARTQLLVKQGKWFFGQGPGSKAALGIPAWKTHCLASRTFCGSGSLAGPPHGWLRLRVRARLPAGTPCPHPPNQPCLCQQPIHKMLPFVFLGGGGGASTGGAWRAAMPLLSWPRGKAPKTRGVSRSSERFSSVTGEGLGNGGLSFPCRA